MIKKLLVFFPFVFCLSLIAEDELPFYFFRINNNEIPNVVEKKVAQEKLCSIVEKNCQLDAPKIEKYSVLPLYEKPDEKSVVVGAFVNAVAPLESCHTFRKDSEHCFLEALNSFVYNSKGDKRNFSHYVSLPAHHAVEGNYPKILQQPYKVAESRRNFYRYLRAMDVIPKKESKYHDSIIERWYALANPDGSGSKLWLKYKSDLRSVKYLDLIYDDFTKNNKESFSKIRSFFAKHENSDLEKFYNGNDNWVGYNFCKLKGDKLQLIALARNKVEFSYPRYYFKRMNNDQKTSLENNKQNIDPCSEVMIKYVGIEIPLKDFYENGFFNNDFGVYNPEEIYFFGERNYRVKKTKFLTIEDLNKSIEKKTKD